MKTRVVTVLLILAACEARNNADPCVGRFPVGATVYYWDDTTPSRVVARDCKNIDYTIRIGEHEMEHVAEEDLASTPPLVELTQ